MSQFAKTSDIFLQLPMILMPIDTVLAEGESVETELGQTADLTAETIAKAETDRIHNNGVFAWDYAQAFPTSPSASDPWTTEAKLRDRATLEFLDS